MAAAKSASKSTTYLALVDTLADRRPYGYRDAAEVSLDHEDIHTVLAAHPDLAQAALSSSHLAASITDELNSVYCADTEDSRIAWLVCTYLKAAAEAQVFEDVRSLLQSREAAGTEELPDMPATEAPWETRGDSVAFL